LEKEGVAQKRNWGTRRMEKRSWNQINENFAGKWCMGRESEKKMDVVY
jgi:hypothetical protein